MARPWRGSTAEVWFWPRVRKTESCWLWTGGLNSKGYGTVMVLGRTCLVHRVAYELLVGPIPVGYVLDHLCRVRCCVNPAHLEPVSNRVNVLRGHGACAKHARATHCAQGHPFDDKNTYQWHGVRKCKACLAGYARLRRQRRRKETGA